MKVEIDQIIDPDYIYTPENKQKLLSVLESGIVSKFMTEHIDHRLGLWEFVQFLEALGEQGRRFHYIFNHQVQRLLISDGERKVTFSGPLDKYEINKRGDSTDGNFPLVSEGVLMIDEAYKQTSLANARETLAEILPDKRFIGIQGLAAFSSKQSRDSAVDLVRGYLSQFDPDKYAVLRSGDFMGTSKIAYNAANEMGFANVAIVPRAFKPMMLPQNVAQLFIEGEDWGEGSHLYGGLPEEILLLGGGYWTYLEYLEARKYGNSVKFADFPGVLYAEEFADGSSKDRYLL